MRKRVLKNIQNSMVEIYIYALLHIVTNMDGMENSGIF